MPLGKKIYYGWFVLAGAILVWTVSSGTFFFSYGIFLPLMSEDLGWSRTAIGSGLSMGLTFFGLPSPLIGIAIARYGPRKNVIFGNLLAALGMFGMSQCRELWQLYLFFGVMVGMGTGFGLYLACTTLVNNWFLKKKALSMGLVVSAGGLGGLIFPPLTSALTAALGWQQTWVVLGGINIVFAVGLGGLVLIRNAPKVAVPAPGGTPPEVTTLLEGGTMPLAATTTAQAPAWAVARKPGFWLITLIGATNYFAFGSMNAHQTAYLQEVGFSVIIAALVFSLVSVMAAAGRLSFGLLAQRFNYIRIIIVAFVVQLGSFAILLAAQNPAPVYLYAVLFGISSGAIIVSFPMLVAQYAGTARYVRLMGLALPVVLLAEAAGPVIAGARYDASGSYTTAIIMVMAVVLLGLLCTVALRWAKRP